MKAVSLPDFGFMISIKSDVTSPISFDRSTLEYLNTQLVKYKTELKHLQRRFQSLTLDEELYGDDYSSEKDECLIDYNRCEASIRYTEAELKMISATLEFINMHSKF